MTDETCPPGNNRRNWQPADNINDYLQNCREGLETYSDSRVAKFLGVSRTQIWRMKWAVEVPEDLFNLMLAEKDHVPSLKEVAEIGRALHGKGGPEIECCPHCGGTLRVRNRWRPSTEPVSINGYPIGRCRHVRGVYVRTGSKEPRTVPYIRTPGKTYRTVHVPYIRTSWRRGLWCGG